MWSPNVPLLYLQELRKEQKYLLSIEDRYSDPSGTARNYRRAMIRAIDRAIKAIRSNARKPFPWMSALRYLLLTAAMAAISAMFIYAAS